MSGESGPPPLPGSGGFVARQRAYFRDADGAKYRWQTTGPVFAASERELVAAAAGGGRLLEVGCGEGGNLFHLGVRLGLTVGLDCSSAKLAFAAAAIPRAGFVGGDAVRLPFRDDVFDRVLCRDVLHHLPRPRQREAVAELFRVCRPGGEVIVIEANGRNPLIGGLALLVPAERGLLFSTPHGVASLADGLAAQVHLDAAQPFPLSRVVLHYRWGVPGLGSRRSVARLLGRSEALAGRVLPCGYWAYIVMRALKPGMRA
jgi:SAM-dependent methyltransferase